MVIARRIVAMVLLVGGCTGTDESAQLEDAVSGDLVTELEDARTPLRPREPPSPPRSAADQIAKVDLVEKLIVVDAGDAPSFWDPSWTDRLSLELRLRPFGDEVHVELRNVGRERVYWVGYPLSPNSIFFYAEPVPGGEPILQAPCYHTPELEKYDWDFPTTTYSLGPSETLPLATAQLTRTVPDWVVVWKDDTAWCLVVPLGTELRAGLLATERYWPGRPRYGFQPPPGDGSPSRRDNADIHQIEPPTKEQFDNLSKLANRRSNSLILHPAEKPFEGPALRHVKTRRPARPSPAGPVNPAGWRPHYKPKPWSSP